MSASDRYQQLLKTYDLLVANWLSFQLAATCHGIPAGLEMMDIGSGNAAIAKRIFRLLGASKLHLVDPALEPCRAELPIIQRHRRSILDEDFVAEFRSKIDLLTCVRTFHEFDDPILAARNLLEIFNHDGKGLLVVFDVSEGGWQSKRPLAPEQAEHHRHDIERVRANRLFKNEDIVAFWERALLGVAQRSEIVCPQEQDGEVACFYCILVVGHEVPEEITLDEAFDSLCNRANDTLESLTRLREQIDNEQKER
ncbi:MAG: class I SAM-dependent methyltransferase [Patescibacteria group bacterium]